MRRLITALAMLTAAVATAAPAPYPVTVDSRNPGAPPIYAYQSNGRTFRVTFKDGTNASPTTGYTPYLIWATNATAAGVATASVSVVSAATGIVDFAFAPAQLNYAPGRYVYEVGVSTGGVATTYRTGTFVIYGAPGASTAMAAWTPSGETLATVLARGSNAGAQGITNATRVFVHDSTMDGGIDADGEGVTLRSSGTVRIIANETAVFGTEPTTNGLVLSDIANVLYISAYQDVEFDGPFLTALSNLVQSVIDAQP